MPVPAVDHLPQAISAGKVYYGLSQYQNGQYHPIFHGIMTARTFFLKSNVSSEGLPSIAILLTWFGKWPAWFRFFLMSCDKNPTITWFIISDCEVSLTISSNVKIVSTTFPEYKHYITEKLNIQCKWDAPYKLCDFKPLLGYLHQDIVNGFDFWGFGDVDVIYGDIRSIYTPEVLKNDIISSHENITAGHLTIVRNTNNINESFKRITGWKTLLSREKHCGFDEFQWSHQFSPLNGNLVSRIKQRIRSPYMRVKSYFVEQFSTSLWPIKWIDGSYDYPDYWYWNNGKLTAEGADDHQFLYLHFTKWQSNRWNEGKVAAWHRLDRIDHCPPGHLAAFRIGPDGFCPNV